MLSYEDTWFCSWSYVLCDKYTMITFRNIIKHSKSKIPLVSRFGVREEGLVALLF